MNKMFQSGFSLRADYEDRKIGRLEPEESPTGVGVSTAFTRDEGFETALLAQKIIVVERYMTKEDAISGHRKWVIFAKELKHGEKVKELWWSGKEPTEVEIFSAL